MIASRPLSQAWGASDWTYADGFLWGMTNNTVYRMNPTTGAVNTFTGPGATAGTYGAAWTYGNGNLGFSNNTNGLVYQVSVSTPAATPTFTIVSPYITRNRSARYSKPASTAPAVPSGSRSST